MIREWQGRIDALEAMGSYPESLRYIGNPALLNRPRVSIVGSRRPLAYTKQTIFALAAALAKRGVAVVSGAAMGVDAVAHQGAGAADTIAVLPCGLAHRYPAVNARLIESIAQKGLLLSQFDDDFKARPWSFVVRNELVVALAEVLVVGEADRNSGTMRSVEYAKRMGRAIFVLPHRLGESEGSNDLLRKGEAEAIWDVEAFADRFGSVDLKEEEDDLILFCRGNPTYEEAARRFGARLFEAELEGKIAVKEGRIVTL